MKVPGDDEHDVVRRERGRLPVLAILAEARTQDDGERHRAEPADGVDDASSRRNPRSRGPGAWSPRAATSSRRPRPSSRTRGTGWRRRKALAEEKRPERDALADRADDDVAGRLHEHDLEQRQDVAAGVVAGAGQEEPLAAQEAPLAAPDQKPVERRRAAEIRGRRIHRDGAELERVADRVIRQKREHVGREVQHHEVRGVLPAHQAAREQGESGLHEQHEVAGIEGPRGVGGHPDVPDRVRQLHRERLLGGLGLILVEGFFLRREVRIGLVGRLGHDEGIAGRVDRRGFVTRGNAGGIGRRIGGRTNHEGGTTQQIHQKHADGHPGQ